MTRFVRFRNLSVAAAIVAAATTAHAGNQADQRFGAWGLSCVVESAEAPAKRCVISQVVGTSASGGGVVLGVSIDYFDSPSIPTIHFRFSRGADRHAGIGIKIGQRPDLRLPISDCDPRRCEAAGRLAGDALAMFRSGEAAQVAFIGPDGKQVTVPLSLAELDTALDALHRRLRPN